MAEYIEHIVSKSGSVATTVFDQQEIILPNNIPQLTNRNQYVAAFILHSVDFFASGSLSATGHYHRWSLSTASRTTIGDVGYDTDVIAGCSIFATGAAGTIFRDILPQTYHFGVGTPQLIPNQKLYFQSQSANGANEYRGCRLNYTIRMIPKDLFTDAIVPKIA